MKFDGKFWVGLAKAGLIAAIVGGVGLAVSIQPRRPLVMWPAYAVFCLGCLAVMAAAWAAVILYFRREYERLTRETGGRPR